MSGLVYGTSLLTAVVEIRDTLIDDCQVEGAQSLVVLTHGDHQTLCNNLVLQHSQDHKGILTSSAAIPLPSVIVIDLCKLLNSFSY